MPYAIVQGGSTLYRLETTGAVTALTLPAGVTLSTTLRPRFAILGRVVVMVNSPSINLAIDPDGTVRPLCPLPPASAGRLSVGSLTGLSGIYPVAYTHCIKDSDGNLLAESPMGPLSNIVTVANQSLKGEFAPISTQAAVNARRVYRPTTGGTTTLYRLLELLGNEAASWDDNLVDAGLTLIPTIGSSLGLPPGSAPGTRMELVCTWQDRLWGKAADPALVDYALNSENRQSYAWPITNKRPIPPVGADSEGITAFMPRRDELGVARRGSVHKIVVSGSGFAVRQVIYGKGLIAPDSVAIINDIAYGLGEDGVYAWSGDFTCITDDQSAWFLTDTYFNRSRFPQAFGGYNKDTNSYELHLAAAGSSVEDRWISFSLDTKRWYGPHLTSAFTPSARAVIRNANNSEVPYVGASDGYVHSMNSTTRTDGVATAIDADVRTVHPCNSPDIEKVFLQPDALSKVESGGTLSIIPTLGGLNAAPGATLSHSLTTGRQRLPYLGVGRILQLRIRQNSNNQPFTLFGLEIPWFELGRR